MMIADFQDAFIRIAAWGVLVITAYAFAVEISMAVLLIALSVLRRTLR